MADRLTPVAIALMTVLFALGGVGCTSTTSDQLEDYLNRLSRSLQVDRSNKDTVVSVLPPALMLPAPLRRELVVEESSQSINLLEFLSLSSCELGRTLGARNSSLGKLAQPSQRMHLQRDILLSAPQCIAGLKDSNPELASKLERIIAAKYDERMHYWWNAWFSSKEWQVFTQPGAAPLTREQSESAQLAGLQALDYLILQGEHWQAGSLAYASGEMEHHQQQMLATEVIGRWREVNRLLHAMSNEAALLLEGRLGTRPLCPAGRKTPQAEILQNVFQKFYAGEIQPLLSQNDRFSAQLVERLERISRLIVDDSSIVPPDAWRIWLKELIKEREAMMSAHRLHVTKWQDILTQCGMMPGRP